MINSYSIAGKDGNSQEIYKGFKIWQDGKGYAWWDVFYKTSFVVSKPTLADAKRWVDENHKMYD